MSRDERGAGTLLTVAVCVMVTAVAWAVVVGVSWIGAARSAQSAADLSALAGASALLEGEGGCDAADAVARKNDVRLLTCSTFGSGHHVVVELTVERVLRPAYPPLATTVRRSSTAGSP